MIAQLAHAAKHIAIAICLLIHHHEPHRRHESSHTHRHETFIVLVLG